MRKELLGAISALALMTGAAHAQDAAGGQATGQPVTGQQPMTQQDPAQTGQIQAQPDAQGMQTQDQAAQPPPAEEGQADVQIIPPEGETEAQTETQVETQPATEGQADVEVIPPAGETEAETATQATEGQADIEVIEPAEDTQAEIETEATPMTGAGATTNVDDLMGKSVIGSDGEEIGEVEDVILDADSGEAQQVVIASGGFLGLGARRIAVDFSELQIEEGSDTVQATGLTQQSVEAMPEYEYSDNVVSVTRPVAETGAEAETEVDAVAE